MFVRWCAGWRFLPPRNEALLRGLGTPCQVPRSRPSARALADVDPSRPAPSPSTTPSGSCALWEGASFDRAPAVGLAEPRETRPAEWDFRMDRFDTPDPHREAFAFRCAAMADGILKSALLLRGSGPRRRPGVPSHWDTARAWRLAGKNGPPWLNRRFIARRFFTSNGAPGSAEPVRWWTVSIPFDAAAIAEMLGFVQK